MASRPAADKNFTGFPITAAAGVIASITLFLLWLDEGQRTIGKWKYVLPSLMLFLSFMMFSKFRYPSFKAINWRTTQTTPRFLVPDRADRRDREVLSMDGGDRFPGLSALRISSALPFTATAARDRGRNRRRNAGRRDGRRETPEHP